MRLTTGLNLLISALILLVPKFAASVTIQSNKCEMGILLRISPTQIKASFASRKNKYHCVNAYKFKVFPIQFKNLSNDVLPRNSRVINEVKDLLKTYSNTKRITIFEGGLRKENNFFEFKNNLNKLFKSTTSSLSGSYLKKAFEFDFRLSTEKFFKKKRTGIILKTADKIILKGINNYSQIKKWNPINQVSVQTGSKKFTEYTNSISRKKIKDFGLNNSSQNLFITTENLFEEKFFLDKKTKIVKASKSDFSKINKLNSKNLIQFLKKIPKSNIFFYRLNWEKYYFILNN